jgi:hypothetical protein
MTMNEEENSASPVSEIELATLKRDFDSIQPEVWLPVAKAYLHRLDAATVVEEVWNKAGTLDDIGERIVLRNSIPVGIVNLPVAKRLQHWLRFVEQQEKFLVKASVPMEDVQRWRDVLSRCDEWPRIPVGWYIHDVYGELTEEDKALARMWLPTPNPEDHEIARMLSARAEELVAQRFYRSLGHDVRDVAITQLEQQSDEWLTHDLALDGEEPIDVKNARTPVNNRDRYVEHCIPRFKQSRGVVGRSVRIAGVLSPYLKLELIEDPSKIDFAANPICFLGETSAPQIRNLVNKYKSDRFVLIPTLTRMARNDHDDQPGQNGFQWVHIVPPWLYDYPRHFYQYHNAAYAQFRKLIGADLPSYAILQQWKLNPLPALIGAGLELPHKWAAELTRHELELFRRLMPAPGQHVTLPETFLTILTHFLEQLQDEPPQDFNPDVYEKMLYMQHSVSGRMRPLGLHDPLHLCWALCDALKTLWQHNAAQGMMRFRTFHFGGLGLLRGTRQDTGEKVTLLAYCGGSIPGKGKCGYSPLIWGEHETCPECNHLICPEQDCRHCSDNCEEGRQRRLQV